jgi:transposase-like protein
VEDEVTRLVGEPWSRKGESPLRRGGPCRSRIFLDGEPVHLQRTRVRDTAAGREHSLETLKALTSRDALDEDVHRLLVRGVSTRNYDPALGALADGLGLKRSAVSSAFQRAAQKDLDGINGRDLADWRFAAIFIDGLGFADTTCLVAIGLTVDGHKHILGIREGATENATVVADLLANIEERGLTTTSQVLFVLDGSKALKRAVLKTYGKRALIQRCILHTTRNILD